MANQIGPAYQNASDWFRTKLHVGLQLFLFSTSNFLSKNKWYLKLKGCISLHIKTSGLWTTVADEITYWRKRHLTVDARNPAPREGFRTRQGKLFLRYSSPTRQLVYSRGVISDNI